MTAKGILAVVLVLLLAGCTSGDSVSDDARITYYHDDIHGVGCWTVWTEGIDCLPDSEYQEGIR